MRVNRLTTVLTISLLGSVPFSDAAEKTKYSHEMQKQYCANLFQKEWFHAVGELSDPVSVNGFKFGIGSRLAIRVDGGRQVEGVFLGRLVDMDYKTTTYLFEDYAGKKRYMIDSKKADLMFRGRKVLDVEMQAIAETIEQRGETCATYAVENYLTQLLVAKVEGNGELRKLYDTKLGHADIRQMANDYYLKTRGGANFRPIFDEIEKRFGLACKSIEAATSKQFEQLVNGMLSKGLPVLLEFYIPGEMVTSDKQWVDPDAKFGEDKRFWPPNAKGERKAGGHALVAVENFESGSGRMKLLINDSDWPERPVEWDYDKYFASRTKSSGMLAHYCVNAK